MRRVSEYVRVCKICKQIVSKWAKRLVLEFITLQWSIVMRAELEREHWLRVGWCLGGRNGRKHLLQFCQCLQLYTCLKYYERKYLQQIFHLLATFTCIDVGQVVNNGGSQFFSTQ